MALYEFQCARCGRRTEVIQRFSDPAPAACPHCGGALAKLLSSPAFQFKGSGFHATDYGRSGGKPEDSSKEKEGDSSKGKEAEAGASSDAGAGTKGDLAGDGAKESGKEPSKEPTKDGPPSAAPDGAAAKGSNAPSKKKKSAKD